MHLYLMRLDGGVSVGVGSTSTRRRARDTDTYRSRLRRSCNAPSCTQAARWRTAVACGQDRRAASRSTAWPCQPPADPAVPARGRCTQLHSPARRHGSRAARRTPSRATCSDLQHIMSCRCMAGCATLVRVRVCVRAMQTHMQLLYIT